MLHVGVQVLQHAELGWLHNFGYSYIECSTSSSTRVLSSLHIIYCMYKLFTVPEIKIIFFKKIKLTLYII